MDSNPFKIALVELINHLLNLVLTLLKTYHFCVITMSICKVAEDARISFEFRWEQTLGPEQVLILNTYKSVAEDSLSFMHPQLVQHLCISR